MRKDNGEKGGSNMNNQQMMELTTVEKSEFEQLVSECTRSGSIDSNLYIEYDVKRGLRDSNGNGVLTGLTEISDVCGCHSVNGRKIPVDGELYFQGYNVEDIIKGSSRDRFRFEEVTYLLLFGSLPDDKQFESFLRILTDLQELSGAFIRDVIMKATSANLMNSLMKSILSLYSYDENPDDISVPNVLRQSLQLIAKMPLLAVYAYQAYRHYKLDGTLMIKNPKKGYSTAENILFKLAVSQLTLRFTSFRIPFKIIILYKFIWDTTAPMRLSTSVMLFPSFKYTM
jgi:citrate synthase